MNINYAKEVLTHNYNYFLCAGFLVLMFLTGTFWGWSTLLIAAELILYTLSFTEPMRRWVNVQTAIMSQSEMLEIEEKIYQEIDNSHSVELQNIRDLCNKILHKVQATKPRSVNEMYGKLAEFRYRFAKLLQWHQSLIQDGEDKTTARSLQRSIDESKEQLTTEKNGNIRSAIQANIDLLTQRLGCIGSVGSKTREIEAHLNLVKNSLSLIYDNLRTSTNFDDTFSMVDGLVTSLDVPKMLDDVSTLQLPQISKSQQIPAREEIKTGEREFVFQKRK